MSETLRHRTEDVLAGVTEHGLSVLPEGIADRLGSGIGAVAGRGLRVRMSVVEENLHHAFPDSDEAWRRRVAREAYRHLGREAVATLRASRLSPAELRARTTVHGLDDLRRSLEPGRGVLLVTGHLGNWELGAAAIAARGLPVSALARRQSNPRFDARLARMRRRLGVATIDAAREARAVVRALRANRVVGIVGDQDARSGGAWIPFLGRWSATYRGPAFFARRLGVPLFAGASLRLAGSPARYEIHLERIDVPAGGPEEEDVRRILSDVADHLGRFVREFPDQYFWFHRRWKTEPPPELANVPAGTRASE